MQNGSITDTSIYALQLLKHGTDTVVLQADRNEDEVITNFAKKTGPRLLLSGVHSGGTAGGHTQTWEFAGLFGQNKWFVGVKWKLDRNDAGLTAENKKRYWTSQIARVPFASETYRSHLSLPRLSSLNQAGCNYGDEKVPYGSVAYPGVVLRRVEAAVSPDYKWFLIASIDYEGTGHFGLYRLADINAVLDDAEESNAYVSIAELPCYGAFMIHGLTDSLAGIGSIQGYDLDEDCNIYISSEFSPVTGSAISKNRKIVKIPWGVDENNSELWERLDLNAVNDCNNAGTTLDVSGYATEFESVQVLAANDLYLTVSYHEVGPGTTLFSRIYEIKW